MSAAVRHSRLARAAAGCLGLGLFLAGQLAAAAPNPMYPFEGTWIRSDRVCAPGAIHVRTYTAKEVTSTRGHCTIHRVASGSGAFELLEECRRNDRPLIVTETIRMTSPDSMALKRQMVRLKIPRSVRYTRCTAATPGAARATVPPAATTPKP